MPFPPGKSGNPGGRTAGWPSFRDFCRERSRAVIERVVEAAEAGDIDAAKLVLAYAWGSPPKTHTGEGGEGPIIVRFLAPGEPLPPGCVPVLTGQARQIETTAHEE